MNTVERAREILVGLITRFEGLHRVGKDGLIYAYLCPAGYPTQGYGLRVDNLRVDPITKDEALKRLHAALPRYMSHAARIVPGCVSSPERLAALSDFAFNLGPTALQSSTMARRANDGDWERAASECMRWVYAGGVELDGLVRRRGAEARLLLTEPSPA